jgi:hypothetical protein
MNNRDMPPASGLKEKPIKRFNARRLAVKETIS